MIQFDAHGSAEAMARVAADFQAHAFVVPDPPRRCPCAGAECGDWLLTFYGGYPDALDARGLGPMHTSIKTGVVVSILSAYDVELDSPARIERRSIEAILRSRA